MNKKKRYMVMTVIMLTLSVVIIASSSPFRFIPTHKIVKEVNCISCHSEEFTDLKLGVHLRQMDLTQKKVLYDYVSLYGNISEPAYRTIVGPCYSCHVANGNYKKFGLTDPYLYQVGNYAYSIGNIAVSDSVIDAQYGKIIYWPQSIGNRAIEYSGAGNVAIVAELELLSVTPVNASVDSDLKIVLSNYSGQQNGSLVCDCAGALLLGDKLVMNVNNFQNDYFNMLLILGGSWTGATLRLNVSGTDKGVQSFLINANSPSIVYSIPKDFTGTNYLKTNGSYRAVRLDVVWDVWRNYAVNGNIASSDTIWTNNTNGWIQSNTCSAPDAMCHINQEVTHMGLTDGMGKVGSLYTHEMESVTSKSCKICHLRYRNIDAVPIATGGAITPLPGVPSVPTTTQPSPVGTGLYTSYCSSCHGPLASSSKLGRTSSQITAAIGSVGSMSSCCSLLTNVQIQSIADALSPTAVATPTNVPTVAPTTPTSGGTTSPTPVQTYPAGTYYTVPGGIPSNMQGYLGNTVCASCGHHSPIPSNWIPYTAPTAAPTNVPAAGAAQTSVPTSVPTVAPTSTIPSGVTPVVSVAGFRTSEYGGVSSGNQYGHDQTDPAYWVSVAQRMQAKFPGSSPGAIYVVGYIETPETTTYMPFTAPAGYEGMSNVNFGSTGNEEQMLTAFDAAGMKVVLQVEPADANVPMLATMILNKFKQHPSVVGFGVDIEWLRWIGSNNMGSKTSDTEIQTWLDAVRAVDPKYKLIVKHWDPTWLGSGQVQGVTYVTDSLDLASYNGAITNYVAWANHFSGSEIGYQIGYEKDMSWWSSIGDPAKTIITDIKAQVPTANIYNIYWVDFTVMREFPVI